MRFWSEILCCYRCRKEAVGQTIPDGVPAPKLEKLRLCDHGHPLHEWQCFYRLGEFVLCGPCADFVGMALNDAMQVEPDIAKPGNGA